MVSFKKYKNPILYEKGVFLPSSATAGRYSEDIFTDSVLNFIDSNQTSPFFIYYGMALGHFPFQPTPDDPAYASWTSSTASDTTYFKSMIKYMDKKVGQILEKIYAAGIQNNTYIIFTLFDQLFYPYTLPYL